MPVRRILSTVGLSVALLALSAGAILADTTGGNADRLSAAASWEDEFGSAGVAAFSDPAEGTFVDYSFFHEFDVTCDDGSSSRGSVDFSGQGAGSLTIDKKLSSAQGSGVVTGTQNTYDPCTGETTPADATFQVQFALTATTAASTFVSKSKETAPDGTRVVVTTSITNRQAAGTVRIDSSDPIIPDSGEIQHLVVTTKTSK
jgi:hypothetical protein